MTYEIKRIDPDGSNDDDFGSGGLSPAGRRICRPPRSRRVRYSYPPSLVGLVNILSLRHGKRDTSKLLSLPLSTVYRWTSCNPAREDDSPASIDAMVCECEAHGFKLRHVIGQLYPIPAEPPEARAVNESPSENPQPLRIAADDASPASLPERPTKAEAVARAAKRLLDEQYYEKFRCARFASAHGLSCFHFIRVFHKLYGMSPYHYLLSVRARHASRLITESEQPLSSIAAAVGFDTVSSLTRAYQSVFKVSLSSTYFGKRLGSRATGLVHA